MKGTGTRRNGKDDSLIMRLPVNSLNSAKANGELLKKSECLVIHVLQITGLRADG